MTIEFDSSAPVGVYIVDLQLKDDKDLDPAVSEYKIIILIGVELPEYESLEPKSAIRETEDPYIFINGIDDLG